MRFALLSTLSLMVLTACATVMEGQSKEVTVRTPGAENARCLLDNGTVVVPAYTDQTVRLTKNYKDLKVTCQAPGNRQVERTFPWEIEGWAFGNVVTGIVPGVAYDTASKGLFDYPDEIVMSFSGMKANEYPLPAHMASDAVKSDNVVLEQFLPGRPRMQGDLDRTVPVVKKVDPASRAGNNPFLSSSDLQNAPAPLTE